MSLYTERMNRVRENLSEKGLAHTVISDLSSIYYLTGRMVYHVGERLLALYVPVKGRAVMYVNELFPIAPSDDFDIVYHKDGDVATKDMARDLPGGKLGVDKFWQCQFLIQLTEQRPDIVGVNGSFAVDEARMRKDQAEKEAMRRASRINDQVFERIPSLIREGMTEIELGAQIGALFEKMGDPKAGASIPLVCFGANAAEPHHGNDQTVLKPGDAIIVDGGQCSFGYCSDMTRTYFFGSVSEEQKKVYDIVCEANRLARAAVKPGVTFAQVDAAARDYITAQGYGPYFTHRTGHGIGMTGHEYPFVCSDNDMPLESGMTFTIEPGIYLPGKFGVRIEDVVMVSGEGCETLNACSKKLTVI